MTIGSIFFIIAILGIVGLYVARPLVQPNMVRRGRKSRFSRLQADKDFLLDQISQLDFEYETGKMTTEDYQAQRSQLMADTTSIMMQLDELETSSRVIDSEDDQSAVDELTLSIDDDIEAAVSRMRLSSDETERFGEEAAESEEQSIPSIEISSLFCSQCGKPADFADKFCSHCGQAIKHPQHA